MAPYTDLVPIWLPLLLVALVLLTKKKQKEHSLLPPGPPKLPLVGNLHQLGRLAHVSLWKLSKTYGPLMHLQLGAVPALVVSSAEAAREVMRTHDANCCSRPSFTGTRRLSYNHLDIAFAPYGDYWREVRRLCVESLFSAKKVDSFGSIREEEVDLLIDSIRGLTQLDGHPASPFSEVDLGEKMLTVTASIICRIAFGESFRGSGIDNNGFEKLIHEAMCMLEGFCASDLFPRVGWIVDRLSGFHRRLERSFHGLDEFYRRIIDDHKDPERRGDEEDLVDMLIKVMRGQGECSNFSFQLTEDHIKAILMNVFVGGVDNNPVTMTWVMAELARNPRVMKKVQLEIRTRIGNKGIVRASDIEHFKYFKMVLKETFRLHPPGVLLVPKETMSHFEIDGHNIPPKTLVMVNVWAIGRDERIWEKPEDFSPERFEGSPLDYKGQHFELLPFGAGRRICPGLAFGMAIVELTLANLLYSFDWKLPGGMAEGDMDMDEAPGIVVSKKTPLKLVPVSYDCRE